MPTVPGTQAWRVYGGGGELGVVQIPPHLVCPICLAPFCKPTRPISCAHHFCFDCLQYAIRIWRRCCPVCLLPIPKDSWSGHERDDCILGTPIDEDLEDELLCTLQATRYDPPPGAAVRILAPRQLASLTHVPTEYGIVLKVLPGRVSNTLGTVFDNDTIGRMSLQAQHKLSRLRACTVAVVNCGGIIWLGRVCEVEPLISIYTIFGTRITRGNIIIEPPKYPSGVYALLATACTRGLLPQNEFALLSDSFDIYTAYSYYQPKYHPMDAALRSLLQHTPEYALAFSRAMKLANERELVANTLTAGARAFPSPFLVQQDLPNVYEMKLVSEEVSKEIRPHGCEQERDPCVELERFVANLLQDDSKQGHRWSYGIQSTHLLSTNASREQEGQEGLSDTRTELSAAKMSRLRLCLPVVAMERQYMERNGRREAGRDITSTSLSPASTEPESTTPLLMGSNLTYSHPSDLRGYLRVVTDFSVWKRYPTLTCSGCWRLMRLPVRAACGHPYCYTCLCECADGGWPCLRCLRPIEAVSTTSIGCLPRLDWDLVRKLEATVPDHNIFIDRGIPCYLRSDLTCTRLGLLLDDPEQSLCRVLFDLDNVELHQAKALVALKVLEMRVALRKGPGLLAIQAANSTIRTLCLSQLRPSSYYTESTLVQITRHQVTKRRLSLLHPWTLNILRLVDDLTILRGRALRIGKALHLTTELLLSLQAWLRTLKSQKGQKSNLTPTVTRARRGSSSAAAKRVVELRLDTHCQGTRKPSQPRPEELLVKRCMQGCRELITRLNPALCGPKGVLLSRLVLMHRYFPGVDIICSGCNNIVRRPMRLGCGHLVCRTCACLYVASKTSCLTCGAAISLCDTVRESLLEQQIAYTLGPTMPFMQFDIGVIVLCGDTIGIIVDEIYVDGEYHAYVSFCGMIRLCSHKHLVIMEPKIERPKEMAITATQPDLLLQDLSPQEGHRNILSGSTTSIPSIPRSYSTPTFGSSGKTTSSGVRFVSVNSPTCLWEGGNNRTLSRVTAITSESLRDHLLGVGARQTTTSYEQASLALGICSSDPGTGLISGLYQDSGELFKVLEMELTPQPLGELRTIRSSVFPEIEALPPLSDLPGSLIALDDEVFLDAQTTPLESVALTRIHMQGVQDSVVHYPMACSAPLVIPETNLLASEAGPLSAKMQTYNRQLINSPVHSSARNTDAVAPSTSGLSKPKSDSLQIAPIDEPSSSSSSSSSEHDPENDLRMPFIRGLRVTRLRPFFYGKEKVGPARQSTGDDKALYPGAVFVIIAGPLQGMFGIVQSYIKQYSVELKYICTLETGMTAELEVSVLRCVSLTPGIPLKEQGCVMAKVLQEKRQVFLRRLTKVLMRGRIDTVLGFENALAYLREYLEANPDELGALLRRLSRREESPRRKDSK
ncbi:Ring finger domain-containing protein [Giardia muris]|uniref:Ring finger domain-containing protein n=1 Tax=Giardia muris TaxID=5742 RepID=A0A4Z1SUY3_GIAMU|nr:Ring finger domain-containing protein [Giardia muris]|eukprot:TNJ27408.1 Ring finger domain-containing protein [Giardia muris]